MYLNMANIECSGLSWGGGVYPWASGHVLGTLIVGIITLIAFGLYEQFLFHRFSNGVALMPPRIFKNIGFTAIVICASIGAMVSILSIHFFQCSGLRL
jgi:hypothetical protein